MTRWRGRLPLFIGVTGHRNLDPAQIPAIQHLLRSFLDELTAAAPATPIVVLSQLAEGADQLVASLALRAGFESACVMPLDLATYRSRFTDEGARTEFDRLRAASVVLELPGVAEYATDRNRGYAAAGGFIARHATILLALWDGIESTRPGSTADVVRMRTLAWPGQGGPALYQLLIRRHGSSSAVPEAPAPGASHRRIDPDAAERLSAADVFEACGWSGAEEFNAAHGAHERRHGATALPGPFAAVPDPRVADVAATYGAASALAARDARTLNRRLSYLRVSGVLATGTFLAICAGNRETWLLLLYATLLAGAFVARSDVQRGGLRRRYRAYASLAAGLRVALYWRIAGVVSNPDIQALIVSLTERRDRSLRWLGFVLAGLDGWMGRMPLDSAFDGGDFVVRHCGDAEAASRLQSPVARHPSAPAHAGRHWAWLERTATLALAGGAVAAVAALVVGSVGPGYPAPGLIALMGVLPLASVIASVAANRSARSEFARQRASIAWHDPGVAVRLAAARSDSERRQLLHEIGTAALAAALT